LLSALRAIAFSRSTSDNRAGVPIVPWADTPKLADVGDNIHTGIFSRKPAGSMTVTAPFPARDTQTTSSSRPLCGWNG
jgi:hypothetical protein